MKILKNNIFLGKGIFHKLVQLIEENAYSGIFIICDSNTLKYCYHRVENAINFKPLSTLIEIRPGEKSKNFKTVESIVKRLIESSADRNSVILNIGGGVVCDIGGFSASVFKRGIDYINIPTSLMAMTDAAIGGKTGINFQSYKNQIGTYYFPIAIAIYPDFLETLPEAEIKSGFGEIIKYAAVFDPQLWGQIYLNGRKEKLPVSLDILKTCIDLKISVIEKDPFEKNERRLLNAGHTIGHILESLSILRKRKITHGEAVANGLLIESYLAKELNIQPKNVYDEIKNCISAYFTRLKLNEKDIPDIMNFLHADKKNRNHKIGFTLLKEIGNADCNVLLEAEQIEELIKKFIHEKN